MAQLVLILMLFLLLMPVKAQQSTGESEPMHDPTMAYTHHQLSGNRLVHGSGTFPDITRSEFAIPATPNWIVGLAGSWLIMDSDGQAYAVSEGIAAIDFRLPAGAPPLALTGGIAPIFPLQLAQDAAPFSHPVLVDAYQLYVSNAGELVLLEGEQERSRLALNLQPDARIVVNQNGQIAVYANASNQRYVHGIMGDDVEGASLVVLAIQDGELTEVARVDLPGDQIIFEGLSPLWADVNEDGTPDLITTVSDGQQGSGIRVYLFDGERITAEANGPRIGQGFRWQHQLAWGAFGTDGSMELVEVRTPHIGGIVRFYRFVEDRMEIVAELPGYTSHVIGSRNLDLAVAGDFNGDGLPEIVLPSQDRSRIAGIQRSAEGAAVVWEMALDARLASNLAALHTAKGLALAFGTEDGRVHVWTSR